MPYVKCPVCFRIFDVTNGSRFDNVPDHIRQSRKDKPKFCGGSGTKTLVRS